MGSILQQNCGSGIQSEVAEAFVQLHSYSWESCEAWSPGPHGSPPVPQRSPSPQRCRKQLLHGPPGLLLKEPQRRWSLLDELQSPKIITPDPTATVNIHLLPSPTSILNPFQRLLSPCQSWDLPGGVTQTLIPEGFENS